MGSNNLKQCVYVNRKCECFGEASNDAKVVDIVKKKRLTKAKIQVNPGELVQAWSQWHRCDVVCAYKKYAQ